MGLLLVALLCESPARAHS